MNILSATRNKYGGIYIHPDGLPDTIDVFSNSISRSIEQWKSEEVQVVWLFISPNRTHLIQTVINLGFEYHHCSAMELMMVKRLKSNAVVPSYATHTIGVGALSYLKKKRF